MNGFERISQTLAGQATDRVPVMLHNFMFAARDAGMTMQEFRSDPKNMAKAFIDASRKYGLDGILTDMDTALEAHALGAKIHSPDDLPAKVIVPAANDLDEVIELADAEKLKTNERIQIYLDAIRLIHQETAGELFLRGNADQGTFSVAAAVYGLTNLMIDLTDAKKEEKIFRLLERCYEVHLAFHLMVKDAGADMTSFGDSMASPDLISPKMYRKFAAPFQKRLASDLAKRGIQTVCHICGKTDLILKEIAENHFAGVEIDYKTNLSAVAETMKNVSVVFGIIDPSGVFCRGRQADVVSATQTVLQQFPDGGLVIGAGCALPAETPADNIRAFVQTVRESEKLKTKS
ncbi:MAG: uroporphyrinogen decarboxylase family protein [Planctomycetaceae bacterium]|jgi:uroporphyrinogen decarboxylase|nr:uroporphyrinogen decarboxylase family protein [Planctomycetaceae bacterium]